MSVEQRIDDLIEAGWGVLDSDFDPVAFQTWRRSAFECLTAMVGPDHVYTRHFAKLVGQGEKPGLLAASGILSAVQQRIAGGERQSVRRTGGSETLSARIEKTCRGHES